MTTQYIWTFPSVEIVPQEGNLENVIRTVHWRLRAERDGVSSQEIYGSETLAPAVAATFRPLDQITKEIVTGWIEAHMGDRVAAAKVMLDAEIDAQLTPDPSKPVPITPAWA